MRRSPGGDALGDTNAFGDTNGFPNDFDKSGHASTRDADVRAAYPNAFTANCVY